ncbi:MAG TPA: MBL fold metallo-hydrolase [Candidatus Solibacter sp.]|nr:MBL fold metallo-hydrolase [Candidatus Solibacter sp.]
MTRFFRLICLLIAAFAPAAFGQTFTVTLLGTGTPRPTIKRFGPSILVQAGGENLLFDCGRGATIRLAQLKVDRIDGLFLTHLHSDHTVGIPDLWLTGWVMGRKTPLRIWGPEGTRSMMEHLEQAYAFDIHMRRDVDEMRPAAGIEVQAQDIQPGVVYENGGVKVTAFLVDHGPVKPAFGYRIDLHGHSVTLSGDTRYSENLIKCAQGTDVLIHEVIDPEAYAALANGYTQEEKARVLAHHTTPEEAGRIFTKVAPKLAVYSHIVPPEVPTLVQQTRKSYSGPLEVGEDLMAIEIGDRVTVRRPGP